MSETLNLKELADLLHEDNRTYKERRAVLGECFPAMSGLHTPSWITVPISYEEDDHGNITIIPEHKRGFCWSCDERFTDSDFHAFNS